MATNLFSTYSTGENRVTASILAVLQSLSLNRIERLLGALMGQSEFELIHFQNQPKKDGAGIPDAVIQSSCYLLLETKIIRGTVRSDQLLGHLKRLDGAAERDKKLLVLTPDVNIPKEVEDIRDERLIWASFSLLDQAIDELLADKNEVVSEREAFLLRELQVMLAAEDLVGSALDVVVVPARHAWPEYQRFSAYVCQPNRPFQPVKRIAFYTDGQIFPLVPAIVKIHPAVEFRRGKHEGELGKLVDDLLNANTKEEGASYKVIFLSPPEDPRTLNLKEPIINKSVSKSGGVTAFTQKQRYVSEERLKKAKTTRDLVDNTADT